jgi:hypothetical protein
LSIAPRRVNIGALEVDSSLSPGFDSVFTVVGFVRLHREAECLLGETELFGHGTVGFAGGEGLREDLLAVGDSLEQDEATSLDWLGEAAV